MKYLVLITFTILWHHNSFCQKPVELGDVHWLRDLSQAQSQSKISGKPILILFQEVPGCATCQRYGTQVLKYPLIVEAIETEFIPLAIHNNQSGADASVLKLFKEPSWNNPVVRIVDDQLKDLVSRLNDDYSPRGMTITMINALTAAHKPVPQYLQLLKESFSENTRQLTFGMYCFWEGEKRLGALQGVTRTTPGFMNGGEVVLVDFDPSVISPQKLLLEAQKQECASQVYAHESDMIALRGLKTSIKPSGKFKEDKDPQYYLLHSSYAQIKMLPIQATKVNSALGFNHDPSIYLSPGQLRQLKYNIK